METDIPLETNIPLILLPTRLAVCRLPVDSPAPEWARPGELLAFITTRDEFCIVCEEKYVPPEIKAERGWRALKVQGPLDFSLVGVLAAVIAPLAQASVSIFALSTFDTDYVLVKENLLERALAALGQAGRQVLDQDA